MPAGALLKELEMKKMILALALGLLASSAFAQQIYCGLTGFTNNTGAITSSFRCRPQPIQRGTGPIVLNATSTITSASGGFTNIETPDTLPVADAVFFKTSGLMVRSSDGLTYIYRVTAKASASSIAALAGGAAPAESGTFSDWSWWSTTCYRVGVASIALTDQTVGDKRLWAALASVSSGINNSPRPATLFNYNQATMAATTSVFFLSRPSGLGAATGFGLTVSSNTPARGVVATTIGANNPFAGMEYSITVDSAATNNYPVGCILVAK
jgi:hypothetical protein